MDKSKVEKFNELQQAAEHHYSCGRYVLAKEIYTAILTLCRQGTYKEQRVLSCIDDMTELINIDNSFLDAEMIEPVRKTTKDIIDENKT